MLLAPKKGWMSVGKQEEEDESEFGSVYTQSKNKK